MKKKIAVIGAGFSGISSAAYLAQQGHEVHVFEKNDIAGGRARRFTTDNGYIFDMGPSWYWMPDIIENFFNDFGYSSADFYELVKLDPQFEIIFRDESIIVPGSYEALKSLFEHMETGAGAKLDAFMASARYKYDVGMKQFVHKPCHSWREFLSPKIAASIFKLDLISDFRSYVSRYFRDPKLRTLMEFPVIFLGASPQSIPALYSLMNYGGYAMGTWYPLGGFYELVQAMKTVAETNGAMFHFCKPVERILTKEGTISGIVTEGQLLRFDVVVASSDYHHTETLLPESERNYEEKYWEQRTFAPSCLIYYIGLNRRIPNLTHHTLFFENELDRHLDAIYGTKRWPEEPLFYVCCPSKTDPDVAPNGHENLFLLMPLATGINDEEVIREQYFNIMIRRLENHTGVQNIRELIDYKKSYCVRDFIQDYHAYQGNAYGLANTWKQTAVMKPSIRNRHVSNLFYTGQLTVPGPGVPPSIISGKIVANEINKRQTHRNEKAI